MRGGPQGLPIKPTGQAPVDWLMKPSRSSYEPFLASLPTQQLLERITEMLGAASRDHADRFALCDSIADTIMRRLGDAKPMVARWLDARAGNAADDEVWLHAKLNSWLGNRPDARAAWDRVIDRGIGPRPTRYLARAQLHFHNGDAGRACADLREAFRDPASYEDMERGYRLLRRIPVKDLPVVRHLRLGIVGSSTTRLITPLLALACFRDGIHAEIYEAEYGLVDQEILDPTSGLRRFSPDVVIVATNWRGTMLEPFHPDPDRGVETLLTPLRRLWQVCRDQLQCHVIQHSFDLPSHDSTGHLGRAHPGGRARILLRTNLALHEAAGKGMSVLDLDAVAAEVGRSAWDDPGLWYLAKQHPAPEAIPTLVDHYLMQLRALLGLSKKVLVLDLDNTIWGGVVGEDGVHGLKLGAHSPEGEAHAALQRYALELKQRGVVLAVCSKNNEADAKEPFEKHPEMVLQLSDISVFLANWNDKATNLREISRTLGLGLDSFVFLDDNPTERAWVRSQLPEVAVPEIGGDPSHFLRLLERYHFFDVLALTEEDRQRAADYAANAQRATLLETSENLEDFLSSLDMSATVGQFDDPNLPRITQLVNKTNQFNLTTRRYTEEQLRALAQHPEYCTRWIRLRDRFGDNGLIGVLLAHEDPTRDGLEIDLWLMSCRVLGRRIEELMLAELLVAAKARGLPRLVGRYIPTPKNGMVRDLYPRLGFIPLGGHLSDGETLWEYCVSQLTEIRTTFIRIERQVEQPQVDSNGSEVRWTS
jgi:FkbH-like protein